MENSPSHWASNSQREVMRMEVYQVLVSAGKAWLPKRCGGGGR